MVSLLTDFSFTISRPTSKKRADYTSITDSIVVQDIPLDDLPPYLRSRATSTANDEISLSELNKPLQREDSTGILESDDNLGYGTEDIEEETESKLDEIDETTDTLEEVSLHSNKESDDV